MHEYSEARRAAECPGSLVCKLDLNIIQQENVSARQPALCALCWCCFVDPKKHFSPEGKRFRIQKWFVKGIVKTFQGGHDAQQVHSQEQTAAYLWTVSTPVHTASAAHRWSGWGGSRSRGHIILPASSGTALGFPPSEKPPVSCSNHLTWLFSIRSSSSTPSSPPVAKGGYGHHKNTFGHTLGFTL